jgi:hypothetical protein
MKLIVLVAIFGSTLVSSSLFAEGRTRAHIFQKLIYTQQKGRHYITDTSYPDVHPSLTAQVAWQKRQAAT